MSIIFGSLAFLAVALMVLPAPRVYAQSGGQGKIEGQIVNGTRNADPATVANLPVTLVTVPQGATNMITSTAKSDANGKFAFSNLETITSTRYFVTANYSGVDYFSDLLVFSTTTSLLPATVSIYETTEDPTVVKVSQTHLVMSVETPWLAVQEIIAMENTSDRVYVGKALAGPHRATLNLPILPKAINIQFEDQNVDDSTLRGDGVLTYTFPIGPGKDQIIFQYDVPFVPPSYDFNLRLPYNADKFGIFMADVGATISSQQLTPATPPMAGVTGAPKFVAVSGSNFTAGTTIKATFSNLPNVAPTPGTTGATAPTAPNDNTQTVGLVVLGVAAVAAVGLLTYPILRRRTPHPAPMPVDHRRMDLLQAIADLDDEHDAGKVTDAEYQDRRAALKAKLLELGG